MFVCLFFTAVLEKMLKSPLDCKEIKPVNPKGNQAWFGRTDAEAEALILWLPDSKNWLIRKDPDAEKDWRHKEKGMTEDEIIGWHHWLNGYGFEQAPGDVEEQWSLAWCSPWGCKESDTTEQLNLNSFNNVYTFYNMSITLFRLTPSLSCGCYFMCNCSLNFLFGLLIVII